MEEQIQNTAQAKNQEIHTYRAESSPTPAEMPAPIQATGLVKEDNNNNDNNDDNSKNDDKKDETNKDEGSSSSEEKKKDE